MRLNEMTSEQRNVALMRYDQAEVILVDYETQHQFQLPLPWRELIPHLLLGGLGDPELHQIFQAVAQVEHAAGRLPERSVDLAQVKTAQN